jgi:hypothetical protein
VIGCGHFHAMAHWMFAVNEGFWSVLLCCCAKELGRTKVCCLRSVSVRVCVGGGGGIYSSCQVREQTKNLEHDNYSHVLSLLQVPPYKLVCH